MPVWTILGKHGITLIFCKNIYLLSSILYILHFTVKILCIPEFSKFHRLFQIINRMLVRASEDTINEVNFVERYVLGETTGNISRYGCMVVNEK
jgi:hypothetical protein